MIKIFGYPYRYWKYKAKTFVEDTTMGITDRVAMNTAWILPRRLVFWCYIRVMAHATSGPYGIYHPDEVTYKQACERWEAGKHPKENNDMNAVKEQTPIEASFYGQDE